MEHPIGVDQRKDCCTLLRSPLLVGLRRSKIMAEAQHRLPIALAHHFTNDSGDAA